MIEPGTTIGAFRVEGLLGKGGMASVFRAVQVRLDRPVALKVLNPSLAADEQFFERFKLEGINSARLEHPNIVPVYEAGEDQGFAYLAMKLVDGETFGSVIARRNRLSPPEALDVLRHVATALDYAHGMGFVHRDVKPGNVLIDRTGHVFLSDFGLSKDMGSRGLTGTGQWMGTAEYMPPEQAAGEKIDMRADLYALGCMAFECLTGDPPYLADNPMAVMMAHTTAEIPSVVTKAPDLHPSVDPVMRRAMAKLARDRYEAATAFVEALERAAEGRPIDEPHAPSRPPAPPTATAEQTVERQWPTSAPPSPARGPSYCTRCMGLVETSDVFCGSCGARVMLCGTCGGVRVPEDRFCAHCGAPSEPPR